MHPTLGILCLSSLFLMQYVVSSLILGVIVMAQHLLMFRGNNYSSHQYLTLSITFCKQ